MLITAAICTLNRAESLRRTLKSLATMQIPDGLDWELVIVNNNCNDHTDDVIKSFAERLPIRREFQAEHGLSRARNCAVDVAKGDYIIWTDDDVLVSPGWLAAYAEAFRRWPEAAVFGGPVTARYDPPVPKWIVECGAQLTGPYATRAFGDEEQPLSIAAGRLPFGPSYALRAVEQRAFRYDPNLGPLPGRYRPHDETDVIERILRSGATGYTVPKAHIAHCIGRDRQTVGYIARWFAALGETDALRFPEGPRVPRWFGAPRWLWRQLFAEWVRYQVHRLISPAPVWMRHLRNYSSALGAIRYRRSERS
jgi:glucosyl-dolichyl phosphate glucuronosyltransferase